MIGPDATSISRVLLTIQWCEGELPFTFFYSARAEERYANMASEFKLPEKTKISMNLYGEDLEAMEKIALWRRSTKTEAVRGALATEKLLREATLRGAKVLIEEPGQPTKQIVFR